MEFITIPENSYDDLSTPNEMLNHALGDARKRRLAKRAEKLKAKAKTGDVSAKRATRLSKRAARKVTKIAKVDVKQSRRDEVKQNPKLAPLLLLVPVMQKALKMKGVNASAMGLEDMAKQFYNKIVAPNSNYETVDENNFLDPVTIGAVVSAIVGFVKKAVANKKEGKPVGSAVESVVASDGEQIFINLAKKAEPGEIPYEELPIDRQPTAKIDPLLLYGGIALLAVLLFRK